MSAKLTTDLRRDAQHTGHDSTWFVDHCLRVHEAADLIDKVRTVITAWNFGPVEDRQALKAIYEIVGDDIQGGHKP